MSYRKATNGGLGIITLDGMESFGGKINDEIIKSRKEEGYDNLEDSYLIKIELPRFANGESKAKLNETVRGKDIYLIADIGNYMCTYKMYGIETRKGPDEHFQDIKRVLSAVGGKARRVTVVMPLMYASRQHRRKGRESLDCAMALQELEKMGVDAIITFDVHDPNIQNAIPLVSFENLYPTYSIVKKMLLSENNEDIVDKIKNTIVVSPDTGAMDRAIYYAGVLKSDVGLFYKRRDFSKMVNGKNPIVAHEYLGPEIEGKEILIVDDMIASGESVLDIGKTLKEKGAKSITVATTFALFTEGTKKIQEYYEKGYIDKIFSTNLTYVPNDAKNASWFYEVDMCKFTSKVIDYLNFDKSLARVMDATQGINRLLKRENIVM